MNESEARAALLAQGIRNPSRQLVEDYMHVQQAQEWALEVPELAGERSQTAPPSALPNSAPERTQRPHPSSESNLAPLLRDRGELVRQRGPRRAGRPPVQAPWFQAVASRCRCSGTHGASNSLALPKPLTQGHAPGSPSEVAH